MNFLARHLNYEFLGVKHGNSFALQFVMELARADSGNMPRRYTLDMSKDFIPMNVFCESSDGKLYTSPHIVLRSYFTTVGSSMALRWL